MDDYKRTLYMRAQQLIKNQDDTYVCKALLNVLYKEGSTTEIEVLELFPEFAALFNKQYWQRDGPESPTSKSNSWWQPGWKEPRIRALNCLLRD